MKYIAIFLLFITTALAEIEESDVLLLVMLLGPIAISLLLVLGSLLLIGVIELYRHCRNPGGTGETA